MNQEWLDEDGVYPTEEAIQKVKEWPIEDIPGVFAFMRDIWMYAEMGYWQEEETQHKFFPDKKVTKYHISTGGWSGNESLIYALEKNFMIWIMTWEQSRRGGHYIFEVRHESVSDSRV